MQDNNTFTISFKNKSYVIDKSNINFEYGYAVVEKNIKDTASDGCGHWYDYDLTLRGVINENYDTVLDFQGWYPNIKIFPNGNLIVTKRYTGGDGEQSYTRYDNEHYQVVNNKAVLVNELNTWEYETINDTTIKTKNNVFKTGFEALYDVLKGSFISEKFTTIGPFEIIKDDIDEKMAEATICIKCLESGISYDVICYIDEMGCIRTPLYNFHNDEYIGGNMETMDFSKVIESIRQKISNEHQKKLTNKSNILQKLAH